MWSPPPPRVHPLPVSIPPPGGGTVTGWFQKKCNSVILHRIA